MGAMGVMAQLAAVAAAVVARGHGVVTTEAAAEAAAALAAVGLAARAGTTVLLRLASFCPMLPKSVLRMFLCVQSVVAMAVRVARVDQAAPAVREGTAGGRRGGHGPEMVAAADAVVV